MLSRNACFAAFYVFLGVFSVAHAQTPQAASGHWLGVLGEGDGALRVDAKLSHQGEGLRGSLRVLEQGVTVPMTQANVADGTLQFSIADVGAYKGAWDAATSSWRGQWTQGGEGAVPLVLSRPRRPQLPTSDAPYLKTDVTFANPAAPGATLAGVLTTPSGPGPFPVVIFISGSGPQDRDYTIEDHKLWVVLADAWARRGIATLRFDDRGVGQSTGRFVGSTVRDFASDVRAGVAFLRARRDIDPRRIGLLGHSEGVTTALIAADHDPGLSQLILLAGSALRGDHLFMTQADAKMRKAGVSDAGRQANLAMRRALYDAVLGSPTQAALDTRIADLLPTLREEDRESVREGAASPWMRCFVKTDPAPFLRRLNRPTLVILAEHDLMVTPKDNLPVFTEALRRNRQARIEVLPGLGHLLQPPFGLTGEDYVFSEVTIDPGALQLATDFVVANSMRQGRRASPRPFIANCD